MATTYLTRTATANNNSVGKWTFSAWIKRNALNTESNIISFYSSNASRSALRFDGDDKLRFYEVTSNSTIVTKLTNRLFRDSGAWYHIMLAVDKTLASPETEIYVNGVQETSFATDDGYTQNEAGNFNQALPIYINAENPGTGVGDCVMSHVHFIDGTKYGPTTFGSFDSTTGIWKINTSPSVTYGTNGFFILKDSNSVTDQSGNSNNFTVGAGTLLTTQDNPSNNFPTLNRMLSATPPTSKGCLTITKTNSGYKPGLATFGAFAGKYYAEFKLETASGYTNFGVVNAFKSVFVGTGSGIDYIGDDTDGVAYQPGASALYYNGGSVGSYGSAAQGDIIAIALDIDNGYVYWRKNDGAWLNSGDPTSGSTGTGGYALSNLQGSYGNYYIFGVSVAGTSGTRTISCNFGQGFFGTTAVASAGTNASNHGVFEYDVPAGYTAMCTKGLNE
tara:strand:- start:37 stop:1377 length:1341 start_codon:yes stop_codon:yes gene_type:complete